jgi:hypothetical protein
LAILAGFALVAPARGQKPAALRSPEARIQAVVVRRLSGDKTYAPGDLISRSRVEPIINELLDLGFHATESEELYDAILPESDRLVRMLKTPGGVKFMRQVSKIPDVYDRLERLSWTEAGRSILNDLIARTDGPQLLAKMLTPAGAKAVEETLAKDSRGRNFLLPTGHIHTAEELLARMLKTYGQTTPPVGNVTARTKR